MRYDFTTLPNRRNVGSEKWNEMLRSKPDVSENAVPLSIADMEFVNPPEIMEGLKKFLDTAVLGYTSPTDAYFDAVISWMKRRKNWDVKKEEIICSPGVIPTLFAAVRAFTKPEDNILLMTPAYPPFYMAVEKNGRNVVRTALIDAGDHYEIDFEDMEKTIVENNVPMLFLCNPQNPTGHAWKREELIRLGEICLRHDVLVLSDEIHSDLMMPGAQHTVFAGICEEFADHCLTCTAPSKTFNLAGMQTSNIMVHNPELRERFREELSTSAGGGLLNIMGYEACRIAYNERETWLEELLQVIWENHLFLEEFMKKEMPRAKVYKMEGTYLQWVDLRAYGKSIEELKEANEQKAEVFLDEGFIFGPEGNGFERINLACPKWVLEQSLQRMAEVYKIF